MADYIDWSAERVAELRRLWVDLGCSAGAIGKRWGVSRNAIIGKVHRMGWARSHKRPLERLKAGEGDQYGPGPGIRRRARERSLEQVAKGLGITVEELKERRAKKRQRAQVEPPRIELAGRLPDQRLKPPVPRLDRGIEPPVRPAGPVDLLHLQLDDCRWPLGETAGPATLFCGAPKTAGSYCAEHAERAHARRKEAA